MRALVFTILDTCGVEHALGCDDARRIFVFVAVIDDFFDAALYDCLGTFIAWEK